MGRRDKPLPGGATQTLGAQLRAARQAAGILLTQQAASLGYSKGYVSAIERGLQWPSRRFVEKYGLALGIDPAPWLMQWHATTDRQNRMSFVQQDLMGLLHNMRDVVPLPAGATLEQQMQWLEDTMGQVRRQLVLWPEDEVVAELRSVIYVFQAILLRLLTDRESPPLVPDGTPVKATSAPSLPIPRSDSHQ